MHPAALNGPVLPLKRSVISEVGLPNLYALLLICPCPAQMSGPLYQLSWGTDSEVQIARQEVSTNGAWTSNGIR